MASNWLKARQTKYAAYATTYIVVVLAVVVVANVLANRYNKSYDATANKRYSLSNETKKIVNGLKQDATITYFDPTTRFREGKDLLDEYSSLSPKVKVKYVDPDKEPELARAAGDSQRSRQSRSQIGNRTEQATDVTEEGITGAFIRDIKGSTRTVCFVTGSGEHQIDDTGRDGLSQLKTLLTRDTYQTQSIDLLQKARFPPIARPLSSPVPSAITSSPKSTPSRTYVENGGRALFMLDPPLQMGPTTIADNSALTSLLQSWGVTPDKDLILDLNPIGQLAGLGPQVPLVTSYSSQPIVAGMKGTATAFPLSRSLSVADTSKTSVQKLFESSDSSLATTDLSSPKVDVKDPKNKKGPLILAAAGTYNTGKPNSQGRFVVVGSSIWASNRFVAFNGNGDLATNAINWLCSDEDLISIRPKAPENRPITMTRAQLTTVRIVSQFVLPLIVILGGILVWWKRR